MSDSFRSVRLRVDGARYLQIPEAHRTTYVTGALDMLGFANRYLVPRNRLRLETVLKYAAPHEADVLRRVLDEYAGLSSDRQKAAASGSLVTALNGKCPPEQITMGSRVFHPQTGNELRRRPSTYGLYVAAIIIPGWLLIFLSGYVVHALRLGRVTALIAAGAAVVAWLTILMFLSNKFLVGKPLPAWALRLAYREIPGPASDETKLLASVTERVSGANYCSMPDGLRTAYVTGALDMLCYLEFAMLPKPKLRAETVIRNSSNLRSDAVMAKLDDFLRSNAQCQKFGAANCLFVALEEPATASPTPQTPSAEAAAGSSSPTLVSYSATYSPDSSGAGGKSTVH